MNLIKGKLIHFIILSLLIIYLMSANTIYITFFLKHGKPLPGKVVLPSSTQSIHFDFQPVHEVYYDGQEYYELHGYALHDTMKPSEYEINIVLHSTTEDLIFPVDGTPTFPLLTKRPDYDKSMQQAEFRMLFSKNVLKLENYQIGILLKEKQGPGMYYQLTSTYIEKLPNSIRHITNPKTLQ